MSSKLLFIALCAGLTIFACTHPAPTAQYSTQDPTLQAAQEAFKRGNYQQASLDFKSYLRTEPMGESQLYATYGLARSYFELHRYQEAQSLFAHLSNSENPWRQEARVYQGLSELRLGQADLALSTWHVALDPEACDQNVSDEWVEGVVRAAQLARERTLGIVALDRMQRCDLSREQEKRVEQGVEALLGLSASVQEQIATLDQLDPNGQMWRRVALAALAQARTQGNLDAEQQIMALLRASPQADSEEIANALNVSSRTVDKTMLGVAVVLPLSGRGRLAGREVLGGMELAERSAQLIVQDSEQDQAQLLSQLRQQLQERKIDAIVGPMNPKLVESILALATQFNVPMITLTTSEAQTTSRGAFRALPTLRDEVSSLLRAFGPSKSIRIGLLYADHSYGNTVAKLTRAELMAQGRLLCSEVKYAPAHTVDAEIIKSLGKHNCDAFVIADQPTLSAVLASTLNAQGKTALLPSAAYTPTLQQEAGRSLRRALIALPFEPPAPALSDAAPGFEQRYKNRNGKEPGLLAFVGYGLAQLITQLNLEGAKSASQLAQSLSSRTTQRTRDCKPYLAEYSEMPNSVCVYRPEAAGFTRMSR